MVEAALEEGAAEVFEVDAVEEPGSDDEQPLTVSPITTAAAPAAVRVTVTLTPRFVASRESTLPVPPTRMSDVRHHVTPSSDPESLKSFAHVPERVYRGALSWFRAAHS